MIPLIPPKNKEALKQRQQQQQQTNKNKQIKDSIIMLPINIH